MMEKSAGLTAKPSRQNLLLKILDRSSYWSSIWFERFAMVGIVGIIIATLIDVLGDKFFNKPLEAGTEVAYFLQIIAIAGALAAAEIDNRHVRLEFVDSFPRIIRSIFKFLTALFGLGLFVILAWQSYEYSQNLRQANEVTAASRIPLYPFVLWVGLSCIPLCLVLLKGLVKSVIEVFQK